MSVTNISPRELHEIKQSGRTLELIDVRTPVEFREVHVGFARNVPLDQLDATTLKADRNGAAEPLYVICQSGTRGKQACEKLSQRATPTWSMSKEARRLGIKPPCRSCGARRSCRSNDRSALLRD